MTDGTLGTIDGRAALRFERRLSHPIERVWRAVSEPAELARWFVVPVAWTPALGETFEGEGQAGRITELEAPHVLAWSWGDEGYRFELAPDGDGCRLSFTHIFDARYGPAAQHAAGWEAYLDRLDAHVNGRQLTAEQAHAPIGELHEQYAARFGEDPSPGRRSIAGMAFRDLTLEQGPQLRFERRYRHPIERLWRAITDPDELGQWFPAGEPLEITESDPPRLLAGTWFGDVLRFELRSDLDGCALVFTHAFDDRDTAARTGAGWDRCFARLDAALAGHPMSAAESLADWPAVHERYAERFGVDPELGRRAFAAHPLT
jgi:uncharacterized protein YndB with AHSA1/START domain